MRLLAFIILFLVNMYSFSAALRIGSLTSAPPFAQMSDSSTGQYFYGFSIDIMNAICQHIQQKCVYSPVTLDNQFEALNNGSIDLLLLANPYAEAQLSQYVTSLPYAVSKIRFVVTKDSKINQLSDLKNVKIGVIKTTFYNLLSQSPYQKGNQIITYKLLPDLLSALAQGQVDVILLNNTIAYSFMNNNLYNIKPVGDPIELGLGYGIIALPNQANLIKSINKAILLMQTDGTYVSIYQKYYNPN